ncbi:MAG: Co2+/Mg2+ efflux protein ApaG [Phycisphaerales bacterium]|nr:Co2+/Mg2+ efflux protein ApaG [Phycisphaerales bacterium]
MTHGVRVTVFPSFLPEQSDASRPVFVFGYRVRIRNEGPFPVRLISRRWVIVDAHGQREEVEGPGVIGQQPRILPGTEFDYASYCPLRTRWGTMEGAFAMRLDDGDEFAVAVARFFLVSPTPPV